MEGLHKEEGSAEFVLPSFIRFENGSILDFGDKIRCSLYLWTKMIFRALPGVIFSFSERDIKASRLL